MVACTDVVKTVTAGKIPHDNHGVGTRRHCHDVMACSVTVTDRLMVVASKRHDYTKTFWLSL